MFNICGLKVGRYILFEKRVLQKACDCYLYDENIKIVKDPRCLDLSCLGIQADAVNKSFWENIDLFVYFDGDIPLGVMCGYCGSCYIRGPGIPLIHDNDTVYWFWIFTAPEARGKNIFSKMKKYFFNYYSEAKSFTALVEPGNLIMNKQMIKMGFVELLKYYYINAYGNSVIFKINLENRNFNFFIEYKNKRNLFLI